MRRIGIAIIGALVLAGAAAVTDPGYLPGSRVVPTFAQVRPPYKLSVVGPGMIDHGTYVVPRVTSVSSATIIAAGRGGVAVRDVTLAPAPKANAPLLAVATYDDGVVLHDPMTFARVGTLATGGAPSDVAFDEGGTLATVDTGGAQATIVRRDPWNVTRVANVPLGNEIVAGNSGAFFVSNREISDGQGAVTRIAADGTTKTQPSGDTAEGLAYDRVRNIIYVGNINDGTVLALDGTTLRPIRRIVAVPRVFGLVLSADGKTLYAVANQSSTAPGLHADGYVAAIQLGTTTSARKRSATLTFPLGIALDASVHRIFVTDEAANVIDVLDASTLRAAHAPLPTCTTPWKPYLDVQDHRLFVPCARADKIDVYDTRTLHRIGGAPFATGGYPLGIAMWPAR